MRELIDADRIEQFLGGLARAARSAASLYLTGGACAVLLGWRGTTLDVDIKLIPESDDLLRAIPRLKETLRVNVELASPDQFLPALPGWRERSVFIGRRGLLSWFHYDFYAQALSKIERGHAQDVSDVASMRASGLIEDQQLLMLFAAIEPLLYKFPAVDPRDLRRSLEQLVASSRPP